MNKIFRKCKDFGLMVRLNNLPTEDSLSCVKALKAGNIPLCVVSINTNKDWVAQLKEIAFKEDLFIAAEGVSTLEEAYTAAGNGAQFFILNNCDVELMKQLKNFGLYFVPTVNNNNDIKICKDLNIECIINNTFLVDNTLYNVVKFSEDLTLSDNNIFSIVDLPKDCNDYELWINNLTIKLLGFNYTQVIINRESKEEIIEFGKTFSAIHKCKTSTGNENSIIMKCKDLKRTISYFKWREIYINPNETVIVNDHIKEVFLEKRLFGFKVIIKENEK